MKTTTIVFIGAGVGLVGLVWYLNRSRQPDPIPVAPTVPPPGSPPIVAGPIISPPIASTRSGAGHF